MVQEHLKNIVIVGANGNIGASILSHLLDTNKFQITIVQRSESTASFSSHPSVRVEKGPLTDPSFLQNAFKGQDAAIFALDFRAMDVQKTMIEAAAQAGVKWILPTEYAGDGMNQHMVDNAPLFWPKREARKQVEELAKTHEGLKWIGVATNPWAEVNIQRGLFGIKPSDRTATLYTDVGPFISTTLPQAGLGVARLLSLPLTNSADPRASLQHYANNFAYLSSFLVTQQQIFESLQTATSTQESDWKVERANIAERDAMLRAQFKEGNFMAGAGLTFLWYMGEGRGGNYEEKAKQDREVLGLGKENLDEVVRKAVAGGPKADVFGRT